MNLEDTLNDCIQKFMSSGLSEEAAIVGTFGFLVGAIELSFPPEHINTIIECFEKASQDNLHKLLVESCIL